MICKLKTSKKTMEIFEHIGQITGIQPFALSKISIALSLSKNTTLLDNELKTDNCGLELNRQTITGDYDNIFSLLIAENEKIKLNSNNIFPKYYKAHIDRGALLLENEFRYDKKFYEHMCNLDKGI